MPIAGSTQFMGKRMSVAALQAVQLEETLPSGDHETALTKAFFWAAKVFEIPWSIAVAADLRIPGTVGRSTTGPKPVNSTSPSRIEQRITIWFRRRHRTGNHLHLCRT